MKSSGESYASFNVERAGYQPYNGPHQLTVTVAVNGARLSFPVNRGPLKVHGERLTAATENKLHFLRSLSIPCFSFRSTIPLTVPSTADNCSRGTVLSLDYIDLRRYSRGPTECIF